MSGLRRLWPQSLFLSGLFSVALGIARASTPSLTFYVPFPEADALTALQTVESNGAGDTPEDPILTVVSIAAIGDGTVIWYDQWEDGYEKTHHLNNPIQPTTQIWGDGNPANGSPPGIADDVIRAGTVILLTNSVYSTAPETLDYDARDKIVSSRAIAVTRTYWAMASSTLLAGSVETYDTSKWGTEYRAPVGEDLPDGSASNSGDHQMFEYTALSVMASADGTTIYVDADNNGTYEATNVLNEGETYFVNGGVYVGGRVTSTKPVEVMIFTGDKASNYESRDSTLIPVSLWSSSYFTPVSSPSAYGTRVWLYNPNASAITVNYRYRAGSATAVTTNTATTVAAGSSASVELADGWGVEFYTTGSTPPVFYAYSTTDSTSATTPNNQSYDWSYTLVPKPLLTPQVLVGLGVGRDPTSTTLPSQNGNPVWVTTVGNGQSNATVYVDYGGDNAGPFTDAYGNHYDTSFDVRELQPLKIYDPDGDQTAMLVYTLSTNVMLAAAWGQDTTTASAGEPGLDAGTAVPPVDVFDVSKALSLVNDADGDGQLGPGERVSYEILIGNTSRAPVPADVIVQDELPEDTTYVANSTAVRTSTNEAWVAVPDDGSGTPFPLDGSGLRIHSAIGVNDAISVRFQVDVDAYSDLTAGRASIVNTGTVSSVVFSRTVPFKNETYLHGSLGDRVWYDADGDGAQDAGEPGINGVVVYLDYNTNGVRDAGEFKAATSGDGYYLLTNALIEAGARVVRVDRATLPADYSPTYDLDGTNTAHMASIALAAGQDRLDVDFGYRSPGRLGDFVWVDSNLNGVQDVGEPGLSNVAVRLYNADGEWVATTTSTAYGAYAFTNLAPGTYTVAFTPPSGYLFTTSNVSGEASDSDALAGTNRTASVTVTGGQADNSVDAGFYLPASLSGAVRIDADGDGLIDGEDTAALAGVTVQLLNAASNVIATTTTDNTGTYRFTDLYPVASYTVVQVLPAGYTNTVDVAAPNDLRIPVTLSASGQNVVGNDFFDARTGMAAMAGKVLYLSDPGQALDRIDPVATGDNTPTNTATLDALTVPTVAIDATSSAQTTGTSSSRLIFSHSTGSGNNRLMLVAVSVGATKRTGTAPTVTGVTYGGSALTLVGSQSGRGFVRSYIFRLVNPSSGAANVVVSLSGNGTVTAGATTFTGVDQSTPLGTVATAYGASATPSVTVSSASDQMVFGTCAVDSSPTLSLPSGSGQTLAWNRTMPNPTETLAGAASTEDGSVSVTHSYSSSENQDWTIVAVPVQPASASGGTAVTFSQSPAFALPFNLDSGATLSVTAYVNVVSGTLPSSAAVVAQLSAGDTTFLTVTNAVYNSGSGALVWTGTLPGAVAIGAGQAISLSVSNAQSGVSFQLRYDSSSYPSKIVLPTSSIIAVPGLGVYDAAYPGGAPVVDSASSTLRYVRVTVTDPFGAYDITKAGLVMDGPGASGDISTVLVDAQVVASNDWSKTYEYVWRTGVPSGRYTLTATAYEGTEGVTATASVAHRLYAAALGDRVWTDTNGNGVQDVGEPGLTNVTVRLLNASSNVIATTVTDASGAYLFADLLPAAYLVEFVAPTQYVFTVPDAAITNDLADSDADRVSGRTGPVVVEAGATNLTLDAGLYIPATLFGYVFKDNNDSLVRDIGDGLITNALVRLTVNGVSVASTNTDAAGAYRFVNVPVGVATVLVSMTNADLAEVPSELPAAADPMRNRALPDEETIDAYITHSVESGSGVFAGLSDEPLNFGFANYQLLSAAINMRVFASGRNGVMIDLWTVDEAGRGDIVVYAWIGNAWVVVGRVPAADVVGEGSNKYRIQAAGLDADSEYYFRIVDEAGLVHDSPVPVGVKKIRLNAMRLSLGAAELTFTTEHGIKYVVKVCDSLAAAEEAWVPVSVSVQKNNGWSAYSDKPFMAGPGSQTAVRIPMNRQKAFFKITEADE